MAWARITENGKTTVLKVPDEKCDHGFGILIRFQEQSGISPDDTEAWAKYEALRKRHLTEDTSGWYV